MNIAELEQALETVTVRSTGEPGPRDQPLYRYPAVPGEQERLRMLLEPALSACGTPALTAIGELPVAAAFCLFGSRCICEGYAGGPWSWDLVTGRLPGVRLDHGILRALVRRGLHWWHRGDRLVELASGSTRYLMSLAAEGGLPPGVLDVPNNSIRGYLLELLCGDESGGVAAIRARAEALADRLPRGLRSTAVFDVAVDLVTRIRSGDLVVAGESARVGRLLKDLSEQQASRAAKPPPGGPAVWCEVRLIGDDATGFSEFTRELRVAPLTDGEDVQTTLGLLIPQDVDISTFGSRFRVIADAGGVAWPVLQVQRRADNSYGGAVLGGPRSVPLGATVKITVRSPTRVSAPVLVFGAEPLPDNVPWAFSATGRRELIGIGAASTAGQSMLVALPSGRSSADLEHGTETRVDRLGAVDGREVVRLSGRATFQTDGHRLRLATGPAAGRGGLYLILGKTVDLGGGGQVCWRGRPDIHRIDAGLGTKIDAKRVQWRPTGTGRAWPRGTTALPATSSAECWPRTTAPSSSPTDASFFPS